jgi:hypothetical protein
MWEPKPKVCFSIQVSPNGDTLGEGNNLHSRFWMWYETLAEAQIMTWVFMDFALIVIFSSEIHIPILQLFSHYLLAMVSFQK